MIKKLSVALVAMSIVAIAQPAVGQSRAESDAAHRAEIAKQVAISEATGKLRLVQSAGQIERMQTVTAQRLLVDKALQAVRVAGPSEATAARAAAPHGVPQVSSM